MILNYTEISTNNPLIDKVEVLYNNSFPTNERRDFNIVKEIMNNNNSIFKVIVATSENNFVGFITVWEWDFFCYAEHFAINPEMRGGGIGQKMLEYFNANFNKPIILEVEPPEEEIAIRRINFYKRNGFKLWEDVKYIQPAYDSTKESIELKLMTSGNICISEDCDAVKYIHKYVYGVNSESAKIS